MSESASSGGDPEQPDESTALEHVTVDGDDQPSVCAMYPRGCTDEAVSTRWITAREGSFVPLTEMC